MNENIYKYSFVNAVFPNEQFPYSW